MTDDLLNIEQLQEQGQVHLPKKRGHHFAVKQGLGSFNWKIKMSLSPWLAGG